MNEGDLMHDEPSDLAIRTGIQAGDGGMMMGGGQVTGGMIGGGGAAPGGVTFGSGN